MSDGVTLSYKESRKLLELLESNKLILGISLQRQLLKIKKDRS